MNNRILILRKAKKILVNKEITAIIISPEVGVITIEDQKSLKIYKLTRTEKGLQMVGS